MNVGVAEVCITPPHPILLGGYALRKGDSEGTHDDLYVRCLYIHEPDGARVLLTYDLIGIKESLADRIKQRLAEQFDVPTSHVVLHATHTHAGPFIGGGGDESTAGSALALYESMLVEWSASACFLAMQNQKRVSITTNKADLSGVGGIRRNGQDVALPLRVVGFVAEDDTVHAALVTFPCHPTVMGADNRQVSADYPGECLRLMRSLLGPATVTLFLNGAAGDISTRFTRHAQTFEEVSRLGCRVGTIAAGLLMTSEPRRSVSVSVSQKKVSIPVQESDIRSTLSSLETTARAALENEPSPAKRRVFETQLQGIAFASKAYEERPPSLSCCITAWRFGDVLSFVFWPGEPFYGFDQQLKQELGDAVTLIGYTDGMVGYIPDVTSAEDTAYEVLMSWCGKAGGEVLLQESTQLLRRTGWRREGEFA